MNDLPFDTLTALGPLDGRYAAKLTPLRLIFSEYGLIQRRVRVELAWLRALCAEPGIPEAYPLAPEEEHLLTAMADGFVEHQAPMAGDGDDRAGQPARLEPLTLMGNFPYNISSQILFKALEHRHRVKTIVGMFQKEVAERIVEKPGSKTYGILSVVVQAFFDTEYLFTVSPSVFNPPPKVKSAVIRITRNSRESLGCDEKLFFRVVKTAFNQRRKTLHNALKPITMDIRDEATLPFLRSRAEQLSVEDFIHLTREISLKQ